MSEMKAPPALKVTSPKAAPSKPESSGETVTVACKFINGLELQLCQKMKFWEDTPTGAKERDKYVRVGKIVRVAGPSYPVGTVPRGFPDRPHMAGGFALTHGVSKDFWDAWLAQNETNSLVESNMIFAVSKPEHAEGKAREMAEVKSGYEPMSPDKDDRMPRAFNAGVTPIETADEMKARKAV